MPVNTYNYQYMLGHFHINILVCNKGNPNLKVINYFVCTFNHLLDLETSGISAVVLL